MPWLGVVGVAGSPGCSPRQGPAGSSYKVEDPLLPTVRWSSSRQISTPLRKEFGCDTPEDVPHSARGPSRAQQNTDSEAVASGDEVFGDGFATARPSTAASLRDPGEAGTAKMMWMRRRFVEMHRDKGGRTVRIENSRTRLWASAFEENLRIELQRLREEDRCAAEVELENMRTERDALKEEKEEALRQLEMESTKAGHAVEQAKQEQKRRFSVMQKLREEQENKEDISRQLQRSRDDGDDQVRSLSERLALEQKSRYELLQRLEEETQRKQHLQEESREVVEEWRQAYDVMRAQAADFSKQLADLQRHHEEVVSELQQECAKKLEDSEKRMEELVQSEVQLKAEMQKEAADHDEQVRNMTMRHTKEMSQRTGELDDNVASNQMEAQRCRVELAACHKELADRVAVLEVVRREKQEVEAERDNLAALRDEALANLRAAQTKMDQMREKEQEREREWQRQQQPQQQQQQQQQQQEQQQQQQKEQRPQQPKEQQHKEQQQKEKKVAATTQANTAEKVAEPQPQTLVRQRSPEAAALETELVLARQRSAEAEEEVQNLKEQLVFKDSVIADINEVRSRNEFSLWQVRSMLEAQVHSIKDELAMDNGSAAGSHLEQLEEAMKLTQAALGRAHTAIDSAASAPAFTRPAAWCVTVAQVKEFFADIEEDVNDYCSKHRIWKKDGEVIHVCKDEHCECEHHGAKHSSALQLKKDWLRLDTLVADTNLVVNRYIRERTQGRSDGYALMLNPGGRDVDVFVSHAWCSPFEELVAALDAALQPSDSVWLSAFALHQGDDCVAAPLDVDSLGSAPFALALQSAAKQVLLLDSRMSAVERLWCLVEARMAQQRGLLVTPWLQDLSKCADAAARIELLDLGKARTALKKDLTMLRAFITNNLGGLEVASTDLHRMLGKAIKLYGQFLQEHAVSIRRQQGELKAAKQTGDTDKVAELRAQMASLSREVGLAVTATIVEEAKESNAPSIFVSEVAQEASETERQQQLVAAVRLYNATLAQAVSDALVEKDNRLEDAVQSAQQKKLQVDVELKELADLRCNWTSLQKDYQELQASLEAKEEALQNHVRKVERSVVNKLRAQVSSRRKSRQDTMTQDASTRGSPRRASEGSPRAAEA